MKIRLSRLRGRIGRFVLPVIGLLLMTAGMFALGAVLMAYDPDGQLIRRWLHDNRWVLLVWRLMVYAGIAALWVMKVRPLLLARQPELRSRLPRTELAGAVFILITESAVWIGKL